MLGLNRFSGTKHVGEIWGYDLSTSQPADSDPLQNNAAKLAVPHIKKDMTDAEREEAFDKLEAFYTSNYNTECH